MRHRGLATAAGGLDHNVEVELVEKLTPIAVLPSHHRRQSKPIEITYVAMPGFVQKRQNVACICQMYGNPQRRGASGISLGTFGESASSCP
jgi:hypothetical protein